MRIPWRSSVRRIAADDRAHRYVGRRQRTQALRYLANSTQVRNARVRIEQVLHGSKLERVSAGG
jgi:hypothetical protein